MKINKHLSIILGGLIVMTILMTSLRTQASNSSIGVANGFKVSPVIYEITVNKGTTQTEPVYVTNVDNHTTVIAQPIINDFEASADETGQPEVMFNTNQSAPTNSFKSITKPIADVTIPANQTATIPVVISVPKNAQSGGYYGVVRFVSGVNNATANKNVSLSASVGTLFLITVPGNLTEKLQPLTFSAANNGIMGRFFVNPKKLSIVARLQNVGNIHVAPFGKVQISDHSGKVVEEYEFNPGNPRGVILPNSIRKFTNNLSNRQWAGEYSVVAYLGYGTQGNLLTLKATFWAIPLWFVILVSLVVVIIIIVGYMVYRRRLLLSKNHKAKLRR